MSFPRPLAPSSNSNPEPVEGYPIYFFGSNTSGEKAIEEFYTEKEELDNDSFINLGVVKNSRKRSIQEIDEKVVRLQKLFNKEKITKTEVMEVLNSIAY